MDAQKAMFEVDSMVGEFSCEVQKLAFCRQMIEDAANGGGGLERMGENNIMGLAHIMTDLEKGFDRLKAEVKGLFNETKTENAEVSP